MVLLAASASAQNMHARTDDGKEVELRADGTWKLVPISKEGTHYRDKGGLFELVIPKKGDWAPAKKALAEDAEFSFVWDAKSCYAMVLTENIPLTAEDVFNYMWANLDSSSRTLVGSRPYSVGAADGKLYEFDFEREGLKFRANLFVYSGADWYVRVFAWSFKSIIEKNPDYLLSFIDKLHVLKP